MGPKAEFMEQKFVLKKATQKPQVPSTVDFRLKTATPLT